MNIFDKVKSIFPELKSIVKVKFNLTLNINSHNKYTTNTNNEIDVNLNALDNQTQTGLVESLKESVLSKKAITIQKTHKDKMLRYKKFEKIHENEELIKKIKGIIPEGDIHIWRACIYLRHCFKSDLKEIFKERKNEIKQNYGHKGINIAKLTTAGYLEEWLIPLYSLVKKNGMTLEYFKKLYKVTVEQMPFTVFVSSYMDKESIGEQINHKIEISKKYGINFLVIHGMGKDNIKKIREIIPEIEEKYDIEPTINGDNNIMSVEFILKK